MDAASKQADSQPDSLNTNAGDDAIGYGKPPKQHQFRKGQSGNPKGRPKKPKPNFCTGFENLLDETVATSDGRLMGKDEAFVRSIINGAMQCKRSDFKQFMQLCEKAGYFEPRPSVQQGGILFLPAEAFEHAFDALDAAAAEKLGAPKQPERKWKRFTEISDNNGIACQSRLCLHRSFDEWR